MAPCDALVMDVRNVGVVDVQVPPCSWQHRLAHPGCLHALTAASSLPSKAAVRRLVAVTLAGLRPPR